MTKPSELYPTHIHTGRLFLATVLLCIFILTMPGCKTTDSLLKKDGSEDFDAFYDQFHIDEKFQLSRIQFPLDGYKNDPEGREKWSRSNWVTMKVKIYDIDQSTFNVTYNKKDDNFYQKVWIDGSGFMSEYRFNQIKGKWYLTYAREENF